MSFYYNGVIMYKRKLRDIMKHRIISIVNEEVRETRASPRGGKWINTIKHVSRWTVRVWLDEGKCQMGGGGERRRTK